MTLRKELGNKGERLAEEYLKGRKYKILEKNFRSWFGEIDIIAQEEKEIVFVEVKTKSSHNFGSPEQEFNLVKRRKFKRAIQSWLWENKITGDNWRVDLLTLDYSQVSRDSRNPQIRHYKYFPL